MAEETWGEWQREAGGAKAERQGRSKREIERDRETEIEKWSNGDKDIQREGEAGERERGAERYRDRMRD